MTQTNSYNQDHYHEHNHHHYYYDHQFQSKFNGLSTNQNHHQLKPTYQVYSRAYHNYALTIRDGKLILAPSNPSDPLQHWYKEHKFGAQVKDAMGLPGFALVNKATGETIKHDVAAFHLPVQLIKYDHDGGVDHSILWTEACISDDNGEYKSIRMVNNIGMNMDAFRATKEFGGVQDGTAIVLWEWNGGDNQRWKIIPY